MVVSPALNHCSKGRTAQASGTIQFELDHDAFRVWVFVAGRGVGGDHVGLSCNAVGAGLDILQHSFAIDLLVVHHVKGQGGLVITLDPELNDRSGRGGVLRLALASPPGKPELIVTCTVVPAAVPFRALDV